VSARAARAERRAAEPGPEPEAEAEPAESGSEEAEPAEPQPTEAEPEGEPEEPGDETSQ
jgi:hypothetical protein